MTHYCLICGMHLYRYDGWTGEVPPVCKRCGEQPAVIHPNWLRRQVIDLTRSEDEAA